ncbi:MAG: ABC-F family ATP-binding cassette domain-containing protein [Alphaproteobacteria bacterium]|nr:ABC-F family ATP-binding cassette domain-containing protein [Alphaproteobacteria bacterium]
MAVLLAEEIDKAYADRAVLRGASISVDAGEHVGLVGVNGSGKSTLLAILAGTLEPDRGRVVRRGRIARLDQDPALPFETVGDAMRDALRWHGELVARWEKALADGDEHATAEAQQALDLAGWEVGHKIEATLQRLGAPTQDTPIARLSGGERRRVALAAVLLTDPDLLLLDEPTNHLDTDATEWLEAFLQGFRGAVLLVTHDRYLLEAVADRLVEVDQGTCVSYDGSYADYLVERAERQARQQQHRERMIATVAREAAWAARQPSARRTKQKARLARLDVLREQVPQIEDREYAFSFETGVPRSVTLAEWHGVSKRYGDRVLFRDVTDVLRPGDRVGVLGPNGAGKSTLLRTLTGEVVPDAGEVLKASRTRIGLLDQARTGLKPDDTVFEAAGEGHDHVIVGDNSIHVATFLGRFAFTRESFGQRVSALSGGERARLLLAKLMLTGANLLVLDEPTNDLDLMTLRVLEEALIGFDGALLVVSHDRAFTDRVCTRVLAFEGEGRVVPYASRSQWMDARRRKAAEAPAPVAAPRVEKAAPTAPKQLSYKEKKELEELPARIEALETEQAGLEAALGDPGIWAKDPDGASAKSARVGAIGSEIEVLFTRWDELSQRA